jgi:hypothetical protein
MMVINGEDYIYLKDNKWHKYSDMLYNDARDQEMGGWKVPRRGRGRPRKPRLRHAKKKV